MTQDNKEAAMVNWTWGSQELEKLIEEGDFHRYQGIEMDMLLKKKDKICKKMSEIHRSKWIENVYKYLTKYGY